jgi:hypothetical protein
MSTFFYVLHRFELSQNIEKTKQSEHKYACPCNSACSVLEQPIEGWDCSVCCLCMDDEEKANGCSTCNWRMCKHCQEVRGRTIYTYGRSHICLMNMHCISYMNTCMNMKYESISGGEKFPYGVIVSQQYGSRRCTHQTWCSSKHSE